MTEKDKCVLDYILQDYGQETYQNFQEQLESFDFEEYLEETLSMSAKICEDELEAEKAMETEKFLKEAYDNLCNMKSSPYQISDEGAEEQRKAIEKFLAESYNNMLRMFDGAQKTTDVE
ncbi:hypothetical protein PTKIN_Ptkin09bG0079200 [Pterospermum kingtungense]